jgi:hypothetical protein
MVEKKLTLLLGLLGGGITTSSGSRGSTASRGGGTTARADVGKEILDVLALESLSSGYYVSVSQFRC